LDPRALPGLRPEQTAALYSDLLKQYKCVTTPEEFIAAFKKNALTCVSDDLVARLSNGPDETEALRRLLVGTDAKAASFFSGADALAKYLRFSFPLSLGDNIPQVAPNPYAVQTYSSAGFAGLRQARNGQALVNSIGFGAPDWSTTDAFVLGVFSKAAVRAAMRSDNEYYQVNERGEGVEERKREKKKRKKKRSENASGSKKKNSSHFSPSHLFQIKNRGTTSRPPPWACALTGKT
jgi:hypothetical protein